jgi:FKBP-type peptidyl-prolyl cis-trans isomerase 2
LKAATGPILSRTSLTHSATTSSGGRVRPLVEAEEAHGQLALELVRHADHGAFGHVRMGGQHLLHAAGRQPVAGHVDDVIGARHDVEIAVLVDHARVAVS